MSTAFNCMKCGDTIDDSILRPEWHDTPKKIGTDFEIMKSGSGRGYAVKIKTGNSQCYVGAGPIEVALWFSREGMYKVFGKVYKEALKSDNKEILKILENANLDLNKMKE